MPVDSPTRFTMVPARRSNEPTARSRARRILIALFLAASLSVVAIGITLTKKTPAPDLSTVNPQGRELAYMAAMNFLNGKRQTVPSTREFEPDQIDRGARFGSFSMLPYRSMSWVGFTPQNFGAASTGYSQFEVHHFLVMLVDPADIAASPPNGSTTPAPQTPRPNQPTPGNNRPNQPAPGATNRPSGNPVAASPSTLPSVAPTSPPSGSPSASPTPTPSPSESGKAELDPNLVQLDVGIMLTEAGPRLAGAPSISIWQGGVGEAAGEGAYGNFTEVTNEVTEGVKNQIYVWAKAYVNGDSTGLLNVTGDQNAAHRYQGLTGFTLPETSDAVQLISAIKAGGEMLIVRTRVLLARKSPDGTVPNDQNSAGRYMTYADFDLLVGSPSGAQPPVVAWGPAGSAAELETYYNALPS